MPKVDRKEFWNIQSLHLRPISITDQRSSFSPTNYQANLKKLNRIAKLNKMKADNGALAHLSPRSLSPTNSLSELPSIQMRMSSKMGEMDAPTNDSHQTSPMSPASARSQSLAKQLDRINNLKKFGADNSIEYLKLDELNRKVNWSKKTKLDQKMLKQLKAASNMRKKALSPAATR